MDIFDEVYSNAYSPEDLFSPSRLEQGINNSIDNSNDEQHLLDTEINIPELLTIPQQLFHNNNEEISGNSAENAGLISQNNNREIEAFNPIVQNNEIKRAKKKTYKNKGRREKFSTLTDGHTGDFPGNLLRKDGTTFMDSMYTCLNERCKIYSPKLKLKK